jgi:hypothetical protein
VSKVYNILTVSLGSISFASFGAYVHIKREATTKNALESKFAESLQHEPRARGTARLPPFPLTGPYSFSTPLTACVDCSVNRLPRSILIIYRYATSDGISDDV